MQNVFGGNGFLANSTLGKRKIFRNPRIEVMRDHHHIEGLIEGIYRIGSSWSRGRWNDVWFAAHLDDVRGMSAACPFRVKGVNGSALEGCNCILDETALVERVGMDKNLHVHVICDRQAVINGRGCCAPVLMKLEAACPGLDLLNEAPRRACVPFAEKAKVYGKAIGGLQHLLNVPGTWSTGGCICPDGRARPASHHRGQA